MSILYIAILIVCGAYMLLNFKHDLQMLQQNSYRPERYWKYLKGDMSSGWRLVDVALLFLLFSTLAPIPFSALAIALVALAKIAMILRRKSKKPLVFTPRVKRLYAVTGVLSVGAYLACILCTGDVEVGSSLYTGPQLSLGLLLLMTIFSWAIVMLALYILMPVEKAINQRYIDDAARMLREMPDMTVIGITGSYGKTSTKHYLNRILSEQFDVLMTPGSYNTTMGVVRTVRELMKPYQTVFICEMGAKQPGDIKEICDLVHPKIGVVTAVGPMHLESFKTLENVQKTKFELIDSLPADGLAVINQDFEKCADRSVENVEAVRYTAVDASGAQWHAEEIVYSPEGTAFTAVGPDGSRLDLKTKLLGECNISNLMAAVIVAKYLGVSDDKIQRAVAAIEQVEHRLSIKQTPGGVTIIDDAFNSNPSGSRMALDVLSRFTDGKRIVITPGMIELGDKQAELNRELGEHIGKSVDVAFVVGEYNREAIVKGILSTDFDEKNLHCVASFNEAQQLLGTILAKGDTVLYENDLPDTFK